jgi:hypothetical protein
MTREIRHLRSLRGKAGGDRRLRSLEAPRARIPSEGSESEAGLGRGLRIERTCTVTHGGDGSVRLVPVAPSVCEHGKRIPVVNLGGRARRGIEDPKGRRNGFEAVEKARVLGSARPGEDADSGIDGQARLQLVWHRGEMRGDEDPSPRDDGNGAA